MAIDPIGVYTYSPDDGKTRPVRLRASMAALAGTSAGGEPQSNETVVIRGYSKRKRGLTPRHVRYKETNGGRYLTVIRLTQEAFEASKLGDTISHNGSSWKLVSKVAEISD